MVKHPELIQRPFVVKGKKAVLARPAEKLADLGNLVSRFVITRSRSDQGISFQNLAPQMLRRIVRR